MPSYENGGYSLGYIDPTDTGARHLKEMMDAFYQANYVPCSSFWLQGALDLRFKVGDQWLYNLIYGNNSSQAQKFFINLIRRHIDMMTGYQRRNRKSTITLPLHDQDDPLADDYNTVLKWSEDRDGYQEYHSQSFEMAISAGMALEWLYLDYALDPMNGDLFTDMVGYNNFLIDQYFRKQDLSDCQGVWRRRWVSKENAKLLLPGYEKEIDRMKTQQMRDGRFPLQAELQNIAITNLFSYDEFHYRTTREAKMIVDPYTQEAIEWEEDKNASEDELKKILKAQPWLQVKKMQIPTCKMILVLGNKQVYHGANHLNIDNYPCAPAFCYHEPDMQSYAWRICSKVRSMRDPQWLYNMRKVIELNILQTQINSGWIYKVDRIVDVKSLRQSGEGFVIPIKGGDAPIGDSVQRIEPAAIPGSLLELSQGLANDITAVSGVNEELLGSAVDDKAGVLSMLRQSAGLTTLQSIYDRLDYTQKIYGNIRLEAIRKNFSPSKVERILGHKPDPRFFMGHMRKYAVAVEEGSYTTTQRQLELQQLLAFREMGLPISDSAIIKKSFISDKKKLMEEMAQTASQAAQQQQMQAQIDAQVQGGKIAQSYAKARSDLAKEKDLLASSSEKYAKMEEEHASAEYKKTEAELNLVKIMLELEDMDLQQIKNAFEITEGIRNSQKINPQI